MGALDMEEGVVSENEANSKAKINWVLDKSVLAAEKKWLGERETV